MKADIRFIQHLNQSLSETLPGREAHFKMAPFRNHSYHELPKNYKTACVMALLFPKGNEWHTAYIERVHHINDKHAGQISFPGGKLEEIDNSLEACALRETQEELGINAAGVEIIGKLSPIYVYVSNFHIHPFVGFIEEEPSFIPEESEVNRIIEVPLKHFDAEHTTSRKNIHVRSTTIKDVPYYDLFGSVLWGATAMITSEFNEVIRRIKAVY